MYAISANGSTPDKTLSVVFCSCFSGFFVLYAALTSISYIADGFIALLMRFPLAFVHLRLSAQPFGAFALSLDRLDSSQQVRQVIHLVS